MPIPKPNEGESKADFTGRCIAAVGKEFPKEGQAAAVCATAWTESKSMNSELLLAIQDRGPRKSGFGYGIHTADKYVRTLLEKAGSDACYQAAATRSTSFDDVLTKAAKTLTYTNPDMLLDEVEWQKKAGVNLKDLDGIELPPNTLMVFRHVLTTPRKDRDGDVMRTLGAQVDKSMLLLWQHVHTLPIGKFLRIVDHNEKVLRVMSAIVDVNPLAHDSAVMIDNGMGRFSHGFRAIEFSQIKETQGETTGGGGFDVKKFEIMEESLISVPSNIDAETEDILLSLVGGGKLTSGIMKSFGAELQEKRPLRVPIAVDVKLMVNGKEVADAGSTEGEGKTVGGTTGAPKETDGTATGKTQEGAGDTKMMGDRHGLPGSWEYIESMLRHDIKRHLAASGIPTGQYDDCYLAGTWATHAIVTCSSHTRSMSMMYYRIAWKEEGGKAMFTGSVTPVDIEMKVEITDKSLFRDRYENGYKNGLIAFNEARDLFSTKAGRRLSRHNTEIVKAVVADITELRTKESDMTNGGKAICERCVLALKGMIEPEEGAELDDSGKDAYKAISALKAAEIILAEAGPDVRVRLLKALQVLEAGDENEKIEDDYRALTGV